MNCLWLTMSQLSAIQCMVIVTLSTLRLPLAYDTGPAMLPCRCQCKE